MSISLAAPRVGQLWLLRGDGEVSSWRRLEKRVNEHPFNHAVELIIPNRLDIPPGLTPPPPHYYTASLPPSHFTRTALRGYLGNDAGSLTALSLRTHIGTDNVFAVLPNGCLLLSVDKDTYEQLGLQGVPSRYVKKHRFLVEVDLTASSFKPGKPNYERVKTCLAENLKPEHTFAMTWTAQCSRKTEASLLQDLNATRQECASEQELLHSFPLPVVSGEYPGGDIEEGVAKSCTAGDFYTWLGVVSCGLLDSCTGAPGDYVSSFGPPEPHSICRYGVRARWTGMVACHHIAQTLRSAREHLKAPSPPPWVAVNVWGFADSPISWLGCEHGDGISTDNHYSVVLFPSGHFWCLSSLGDQDIVR